MQSAPHHVDALGAWLQAQPLASIEYRGARHPVLGASEAPLLVVLSQQDRSADAGVMSGDDGRLLELMLGAIAMSPRDTRRCLLDKPGSRPVEVGIDALLTPQTRGILVLMDKWPFANAENAVDSHRGRFPSPALPLWRLPHPGVLLQQPLLKRQAWEVLKQVHAVLDGRSY